MLFSAIIFSAGKSSRLGKPKAFLKAHNGKYFIENLIQHYFEIGCSEIFVVINDEIKENEFFHRPNKVAKYVINSNLELGRFYSVKLGVENLHTCDYCFFQNIDNPLQNLDVLKALLKNAIKGDCIIPNYKSKRGHPVLVNKRILNEIKKTTDLDTKLNEFLRLFISVEIDLPFESVLYNINTLEDFNNYKNSIN